MVISFYRYSKLPPIFTKEETKMKKYFAPEMETLTFTAEEAIAGLVASNLFNDAEFGAW